MCEIRNDSAKFRLQQGRRKQPGDGPSKLSTISRITGTQASREVWGHAPQEIFEN